MGIVARQRLLHGESLLRDDKKSVHSIWIYIFGVQEVIRSNEGMWLSLLEG